MKPAKLGGVYFLIILIVVGVFFFAMLKPFIIPLLLAVFFAGARPRSSRHGKR